MDIMRKDPIEGDAILAAAMNRKHIAPKTTNSKARQKELEKDFFSKKKNKIYIPGKFDFISLSTESSKLRNFETSTTSTTSKL